MTADRTAADALAEALVGALVAADEMTDEGDWIGSEYVDRMVAWLLAAPESDRRLLAAALLKDIPDMHIVLAILA